MREERKLGPCLIPQNAQFFCIEDCAPSHGAHFPIQKFTPFPQLNCADARWAMCPGRAPLCSMGWHALSPWAVAPQRSVAVKSKFRPQNFMDRKQILTVELNYEN